MERGWGSGMPSNVSLEKQKSKNKWGWKRPLRSWSPRHGWALHGLGADPSTPLHDPPHPTQGGVDGSPHIPITSKHFWPQGATRDFSRYPPNILQQEILQQKKSSCNISKVFPLRPEQKCCRNNLAQGKMSVCLVVSAQGSWSGAVGSHSSLATESFWELC